MNAVNITENMYNEEKAACDLKNIDIQDEHQNKMAIVDEKNVNSFVEYMEISKNSASNLDDMNIKENLVNKMECIDIEEIPASSIEVIDEENCVGNVENIDTEENLANKLENIDNAEIPLTSSIEIIDEENPGTNSRKMNTEESIEKKMENIDTGENLIEEITSGENSDNTVENIDSEDNFADIEESCDDEREYQSDFERLFINVKDVKGKIARFTMTVTEVKGCFDAMLVEFKSINELLLPSDLNRNSTSPEKCQEIMEHMEKIGSSLSFIKRELKNWDLVDYSRIEEFKKLFENLGKSNEDN